MALTRAVEQEQSVGRGTGSGVPFGLLLFAFVCIVVGCEEKFIDSLSVKHAIQSLRNSCTLQ
jgi:hypothetical protein